MRKSRRRFYSLRVQITSDVTPFHSQDDRPNSAKVDNRLIEFGKETHISLTYSKFTRMNVDSNPCTNDPDYNFNICIEGDQSVL